MALSKQNRLSLKDSRGRFFDAGISIHTPYFQVIVLKEIQGFALFAVSVSKKVAKKAHDRNLIRRQLLQLIQENLSSFPPYQYLFLPKKTTAPIMPSELRASFSLLLSKLKL